MASFLQRLLARALPLLVVVAAASGPGCGVDEAPGGVRRTTETGGPKVVFDLGRKPLPEIPLPNDVATWPDPSSRTGRRLNVSMLAPTEIERHAREQFGKLEGFGTFAPISIPFDRPLDAEDVKAHHAEDDFAPEDDVVYLVNLTTGVPVPLDLGGGNFPATLRELSRYWPNDPHKGEANLLFETREEDLDGNGVLDPGEDTDFDGVLDHPNFPQGKRPANGVDGLYTFYESETNSLILRPMIPLDELTEYAVVVTDRLKGKDGKAVQSPFAWVHHPSQKASVQRLADRMAEKPKYYGLGAHPIDHVQFAFTFTTQATVRDLFAWRDGAYGKGKAAWIGNDYPPDIKPIKAVGKVDADDTDPASWASAPECVEQNTPKESRFVARVTPKFKETLGKMVDQVFGLGGPAGKRLVDGYDFVDHIVVATLKVPWLLGDVKDVSPNATIDYDPKTGAVKHSDTEVSFFLVVPKPSVGHKQPFPVTYYGHGYTGNMTEGLAFAGELARHGVATLAMNAPGHGLELDDGTYALAAGFFRAACLQPFAKAFVRSRVRDLNGDGLLANESGRDFWSAYLFHTRDLVRQAALEEVLVTRALRTFDGTRKYDWDGDGVPDLAGDFDGNGVPDVGGEANRYYAWGGSLGGILSSLAGAVDPYVTATAPMAGGGSLSDVGIRSFQGGVVEAVDLRVMGPLIVSVPAESRFDFERDGAGKLKLDDMGKPIPLPKDKQKRTACVAGDKSLRWVVVDLNDDLEIEIGCLAHDKVQEGVDVVVENHTTGELRCARVTKAKSDSGEADFRIALPASQDDAVVIATYKAGSVQRYGKVCNVGEGVAPLALVSTWGERGAAYQTRKWDAGSTLVAPAEGFGLKRQTPDFRKLLALSQIALDPADPVTFAPYYYVKARFDENGRVVPPAGVLTLNTVGDMNVPVNTGIAAARIHGAIPFLRPENVLAPDYPDYVAPDGLLSLYGMTPNKFLLTNHVIEGIAWLGRHPAGAGCAPDVSGFPGCTDAATYPSGSKVCANALFDPEDLAEGKMLYAHQRPAVPLRLARLAKAGASGEEKTVWAPRLDAQKTGWRPSGTLAGVLTAYIVPQGVHGFDPPDPCKNFDTGSYLTNVLAHYFATEGTDLYYLSHPNEHRCAAVTDPKAATACTWP